MTVDHPLKARLADLPHAPGVYRYRAQDGQLLYVGKARDLKKRVSSYFSRGELPARTRLMLEHARELEITVTPSEDEALLLEANLIKEWQPRYNVLLRDDKSYPWLRLTLDHDYPRLSLYRGSRKEPGRYFGPYPSVHAVRDTLRWLQRLFPIRPCEDSQFSQRRRPCLQHQIKRCAAPCCGRVDQATYRAWIDELTAFLEGRDHQWVSRLEQRMWAHAEAREYEAAAALRDRLANLRQVQESRRLNLDSDQDLDVVALHQDGPVAAVQVFFVRGGINLGNRAYFPTGVMERASSDVMHAFIEQFYADKVPPPQLLVDPLPDELEWLASALSHRRGSRVQILLPRRGARQALLTLARDNARQALEQRAASQAEVAEQLAALAQDLDLDAVPERIEVYDMSHIQGSTPVGAMIVFGTGGFLKQHYRRFAIQGDGATDDTARMAQVLTRRLKRLKSAGDDGGGQPWPDLLLLDGGIPQLHAAQKVLEELQIEGLALAAIAKGPERHAGRERLFLPGREEPLILPSRSPVLFLLQRIRDEAHRFAIGFHRARRDRQATTSVLESIPGVGPKRRRALLTRFGSVKNLEGASEEALARVPGISRPLARVILEYLRH
ncbi:MAG: excinuclease ABC subunit UvrC [Magnetococcus sp. WYHC-3]